MSVVAYFEKYDNGVFEFELFSKEKYEKIFFGKAHVSPSTWTIRISLNGIIPFLAEDEEKEIKKQISDELSKCWPNFMSFRIIY